MSQHEQSKLALSLLANIHFGNGKEHSLLTSTVCNFKINLNVGDLHQQCLCRWTRDLKCSIVLQMKMNLSSVQLSTNLRKTRCKYLFQFESLCGSLAPLFVGLVDSQYSALIIHPPASSVALTRNPNSIRSCSRISRTLVIASGEGESAAVFNESTCLLSTPTLVLG